MRLPISEAVMIEEVIIIREGFLIYAVVMIREAVSPICKASYLIVKHWRSAIYEVVIIRGYITPKI